MQLILRAKSRPVWTRGMRGDATGGLTAALYLAEMDAYVRRTAEQGEGFAVDAQAPQSTQNLCLSHLYAAP